MVLNAIYWHYYILMIFKKQEIWDVKFPLNPPLIKGASKKKGEKNTYFNLTV